ncbi:MAG: hypothetical protein ABIJ92_00830 [Candidatus Aenigmatarchaeota archaeon]
MKPSGMLLFGLILIFVSLLFLGVADNIIVDWSIFDPTIQTVIGIFIGVLGLIIVYFSRN